MWAVGLRLPGSTLADVERAIAERTIVRTWSMRGTRHFVAAEDVRWMLTPRVLARAAVAALPLIAQARGKRQRLMIAGGGPAREPLEELSALTAAGESAAARRAVAMYEDLRSPAEWGDVVVQAPPLPDGPSAAFLCHLDHVQLASVFAAADVALVPSVFPEAAALVNVEAFAAGALPLASYHSGMVSLDDFLAETFGDDAFTSLAPGHDLTRRLADLVVHVLARYPTTDPAFRARVHEIALGRYPTWDGTASAYVAMGEAALHGRT